MRHGPLHIVFAGAARQVAVIVPCVIIPNSVIDLDHIVAIQGIQQILIRQHELQRALFHILERYLRLDDLSFQSEIHQKNAGVKVIVVRSEAKLVYMIDRFRFSCVGRSGKEVSPQIHFPEAPQWVYDQNIRIEVQDPQLRQIILIQYHWDIDRIHASSLFRFMRLRQPRWIIFRRAPRNACQYC